MNNTTNTPVQDTPTQTTIQRGQRVTITTGQHAGLRAFVTSTCTTTEGAALSFGGETLWNHSTRMFPWSWLSVEAVKTNAAG